ncbi:hypothetical protein RF11_03224 [Thelohanellus kitauei]|uniref:Uncharacterized protein n=1 Tax=Thelohanellus kitauei TaxID=669202 RepID=A0A0C2IFT9_THEKT|nr:hypothetical protein RF11_03224 [Thelohanellus kitauei]
MDILCTLFFIILLLNVNSREIQSLSDISNNFLERRGDLEKWFRVDKPHYQKWEPVDEWDSQLLKEYPEYKSLLNSKVRRKADGTDYKRNEFRIFEIENNGKYYYPVFKFDTKAGSESRTIKLDKILEKKPFENPN